MPGNMLLQKVEAALQGGCRLVQYRDKSKNHKQRLQSAVQLGQLCHRYNSLLLINDDLPLAIESKADGVHLGQTDLDVALARQQVNDGFIIGATCHDSLMLADTAKSKGANYLAFGRFFPSQTKSTASAADSAVIAAAKQQTNLPVVAIGGITVDNAPSLIAAGADSIAVSYDLFHHLDLKIIRQRAEQFSRLF
jgi:thiamine-phosphate pyrophosphorylase